MAEKQCPLCVARGKRWDGSDPVCAFTGDLGQFVGDNWNCATANLLRDIAERGGFRYRDDMGPQSIAVAVLEHSFVAMCFYKERGRTNHAMLMRDDECRPLMLSDLTGDEVFLDAATVAMAEWSAKPEEPHP